VKLDFRAKVSKYRNPFWPQNGGTLVTVEAAIAELKTLLGYDFCVRVRTVQISCSRRTRSIFQLFFCVMISIGKLQETRGRPEKCVFIDVVCGVTLVLQEHVALAGWALNGRQNCSVVCDPMTLVFGTSLSRFPAFGYNPHILLLPMYFRSPPPEYRL
jgi:hypothetical protein